MRYTMLVCFHYSQKQKIQVQFQPKLDKQAVSTEADNLALQAEREAKMILEAAKAKREEEAQKELMSSQVCPDTEMFTYVHTYIYM